MHPRRKWTLLLTAILLLPLLVHPQRRFIPRNNLKQLLFIGAAAGTTHYNGDLHSDPLELPSLRYALSWHLRYNFTRHLSVKFENVIGTVNGKDSKSDGSIITYNRHLNFTSLIIEGSLQFQLRLAIKDFHDMPLAYPYFFGGFGIFHFNPRGDLYYGKYNEFRYYYWPDSTIRTVPYTYGADKSAQMIERDNKYETYLRSYQNEGVRYDLYSYCIPFGFGLYIPVQEYLDLTLSVGWRKTFTDYLDDASKAYYTKDKNSKELYVTNPGNTSMRGRRGNPANQDWYTFIGAGLEFNLGKIYNLRRIFDE